MGNYYERVGKDTIVPGDIAQSSDINEIQTNIDTSESQIIDDICGNFVLESYEDSFVLTPATNFIDQDNQNGSDTDLKDIENVYIRQTLNLEKSSLSKLYLKIKNSAVQDVSVNFELRQTLLEDEDSDPLGTYSTTIPASTATAIYQIPFNIDHLAAGQYYLVIKRTNIEGVQIQYDSAGSYTKGMYESDDGLNYNEIDFDLWFYTEYASTSTFDVQSSVALISGIKIHNLDTHVTISAASSYGSRKDVVCLTRDGTFDVIEGATAQTPISPIDDVPPDYLPIAEVTIYQNQSNAANMGLNQDDTQRKFRMRSLLERMRRVESKLDYDFIQNSPQRIKAPGPIPFDAGSSAGTTNITWDSTSNSYILSNAVTVTELWDLKDNTYIDSAKTTNVNYSDTTNGIAKLQTTSSVVDGIAVWRDPKWYAKNPQTGISAKTYATNQQISQSLAAISYNKLAGYLTNVKLDVEAFSNTKNVRVAVFKMNGDDPRNYEFIDISNEYYVGGDHNPSYFPDGNYAPSCTFSGGKWLAPGWYALIMLLEPLVRSKPATANTTIWVGPGYAGSTGSAATTNYLKYSYVAKFNSWYPMSNGLAKGNMYRYGLVLKEKDTGYVMQNSIQVNRPIFVTSGVLQSAPMVMAGDISSVAIDMNFTMPKGTSYKLEVSNDNGLTFYQMQNASLAFTNVTGNSTFVWRLTFKTNDTNVSPILEYNSTDGYALKANITLSSGSPATDGTLVTLPFDGATIVKDALRTTTNKFSHYEWLRVFGTAPLTTPEETSQGTSLKINLEASEDGTNYTTVKRNLTLGDFAHQSIDWATYGGDLEDDEYNYDALVDSDIITDTTTILDEMAMTSAQPASGYVGVTLDTTSTHLAHPSPDAVSNKIAVGANATVGKLAYLNVYKNPNLVPINVATGTDSLSTTNGYTAMTATATLTSDTSVFVDGSRSLKCACAGTNTNEGVGFTATGLTIGQTYPVIINANIPSGKVLTFGPTGNTINITGTGAMKTYTTSFTATTTSYSIYLLTGTTTQAVTFYLDSVRVAIDNIPLDMSEFGQMKLEIYVESSALAAGDILLALSDGTNTAKYSISAISLNASNLYTQVIFNLDEPTSDTGVDLTAISTVELWMANDKTVNIWIDRIEGLQTILYPFYQNYVRFRFTFHRASAALPSPSVRKIGAVIQLA